MKAIIQRVHKAELQVENNVVSTINKGLVCYLGIAKGDSKDKVEWLARKVAKLRIFDDNQGKMNLSAFDLKLDILVISQFTLFANVTNGYRPSFSNAEKPDIAEDLYNCFILDLKKNGISNVCSGIFGAHMDILQNNDGPVTIVIDTD